MMNLRANIAPLIAKLPWLVVYFWFVEAPQFLLGITWILVRAVSNIFSLPILLKTYFSPWKGEYRKGYVGIARGVGVVVRTFTILISLVFVSLVLVGGLILTFLWIGIPIAWTLLFLQTTGAVNFNV